MSDDKKPELRREPAGLRAAKPPLERPPNRGVRARLIQLAPAAVKALAREFFMLGFRCSGYRVHGEIPRLADSRTFAALLGAEFERAWSERAAQNQSMRETVAGDANPR